MEFITCYNSRRQKIGDTREKEEARAEGCWVHVVHVWFIDIFEKKVLLQKRSSSKKRFPNCLDAPVGGHVISDESSIEGALRETKEELDIDLQEEDLCDMIIHKEGVVDGVSLNQHMDIYFVKRDFTLLDLTVSNEEVDEVLSISLDGLRKILSEQPETIVGANSQYWQLIIKHIENNYFL